MKLLHNVTSYEISREDIDKALTKIVMEDLKLDDTYVIGLDYIIREVGGDAMDRYPGHDEVVGLTVRVTKKK